MHSNPAASGGLSSTRGSDFISAEYYANVARIMEKTITETNRLLENSDRKGNTGPESHVDRREVASELGVGVGGDCNPRYTAYEGSMRSTANYSSTSSLTGVNSSKIESSELSDSARGFRNYVDTPSRYRSKSIPKILETSQEYFCECGSGGRRRKSSKCNCARVFDRLRAGAFEKWLTSSRKESLMSSAPNVNATLSNSTVTPYQSSQRFPADGSRSSFPEQIENTSTAPLSDLTDVPRWRCRQHSSHISRLSAGSDARNTVLNSSTVTGNLNKETSIQHGYVTIMHVDNVYFKCRCGHTCQNAPLRSTPLELCLGKSSKQPSTKSTSPRNISTQGKRGSTVSEARLYRPPSPLHTARAVSRQSPPNNTSSSDKMDLKKSQRYRSASQRLKAHPKPRHTKKTLSRKQRSKARKGNGKQAHSSASQADMTLSTARASTPSGIKLRGPRSRTPQKSLANAIAHRHEAVRRTISDTAIRTARCSTPKRRSSPTLSAKEAQETPDLTLDAIFRVKDQETDEIHTLVLNAEMQGKAVKKITVNGKECKFVDHGVAVSLSAKSQSLNL